MEIKAWLLLLFGYFLAGLLFLGKSLWRTSRYPEANSKNLLRSRQKQKPIFEFISVYLLFAVWLCHTGFLGWHSYLLKTPPITSMYETFIFVAWVISLSVLLLKRYSEFLLPMGAFSSAFFLFLGYAFYRPDVPIAAVLNAPFWLLVHVLVIVASYGFFFVSALASHVYLFTGKRPWYQIVFPCHLVGVGLFVLGTILGGLWAAKTWGSFWSWDVKESWAFITICIYLMALHLESLKMASSRMICLISSIGFLSVTFTWYGINFVLKKGMHVYGFGEGGIQFYNLFVIVDFLSLFYLMIRAKRILKNSFLQEGDSPFR